MNKVRIVHIITRLIAGGAQENTILSCQALRDRYDITLLTGPPDGREGSLVEDARSRGVDTRLVPELVRDVRPGRDFRALERIRCLLEELKPHLVHTHSSKAGILGRAAAWCAGVPVIVHTNHGLPFTSLQRWPVRALYWTLERAATLVSHRVICVGEEMKRQAVAAGLGAPGLFDVVYSGIEIERFLTAKPCRERAGVPAGARVAGVVSRMASHKGHRFLVEACPRDVHLLFVGDGEEREDLQRRAAARGLGVTFAGHVPPSEVPDLIASMDVLVHPSLWEGLPRAAVQALLVGRPVVAFDCDGAREVVEDGVTGRLVVPGSVDGLREALEDVLENPDRARAMAQEGRNRVRDRFEWRRAAERLDAVYRDLLARHGLIAREAL